MSEAPDDAALKAALTARKWIAELNVSEKAQSKWLTRARKIVRLYKRENSQDEDKRRFAMLWANTQTIQPAVYSRPPQPVVSRRFADADPVARAASEVLERALAYSIDCQDLDATLRSASYDFVLLARGVSWERYKPTFGPQVTPEIELQVTTQGTDVEDDGDEPGDDTLPVYSDNDGNTYDAKDVQQRPDGTHFAQGEPFAPVTYEESVTDYVNWEDFGHSVARTWDEVEYVWRRVYLSRQQLIERFGEDLGKRVPLDYSAKIAKGNDDAELSKKAAVFEIWNKGDKKVYWISKSFNEAPLDVQDDPLGLEGFFPCPRPMLGTSANDSTIPVPDYVHYQDQAEEIDKLTARIAHLQDALKVRGFYAATEKSNLNNLLNSDTNILIPVVDWQALKEDGGVEGKITWFPIAQVVSALDALIKQRAQLIEDVYQITGIGDILRGMNDPRATATAEQLKGQWGTLRIRDRQIEMMRFARDILRIKGQIIAAKFEPDTLKAMTGVQLPTNADKAQAMAQNQQAQQQFQIAQQQHALQVQAMQAQAVQQQPLAPPGSPPTAPGIPPQSAVSAQPIPQPPQAAAPQLPPAPQPPQVPPEVQQMLQTPSWEDVIGLLRNNALRQFRVDIETDSTIEPNETEEKQRVVEFTQMLGSFISQWGPAVQSEPALAPVAAELLKWGVRRFRAGRQLEDVIDNAMDKIASGGAPAPAQPGQQIDQGKVIAAQIKAQSEAQGEQAETQREMIRAGVESQKTQVSAQANQIKLLGELRDPRPQAIV